MILSKIKVGIANLAVATLLLANIATANADVLDSINDSHVVRIGIPTDYPPYGFVGIDMKPQGLDIDMAKLVAEKLGAKVKLIPVVSANRIPYLQTNKVNLIISTLGRNKARAKVIDFSHAYAPFYQGVFARKETVIKSYSDLSGKTIAVPRGAMEDDMLTKLAPKDAIIKRLEDQASTTSAFASGQTQAIASSVTNVGALMEKRPDLGIEFKLMLRVSPCFVGVAKNQQPLLDKVNEIILSAKADGTLNKLSQKWLHQDAGELPL